MQQDISLSSLVTTKGLLRQVYTCTYQEPLCPTYPAVRDTVTSLPQKIILLLHCEALTNWTWAVNTLHSSSSYHISTREHVAVHAHTITPPPPDEDHEQFSSLSRAPVYIHLLLCDEHRPKWDMWPCFTRMVQNMSLSKHVWINPHLKSDSSVCCCTPVQGSWVQRRSRYRKGAVISGWRIR